MKKILLILSLVLFGSQSAFAQYQKADIWEEMEKGPEAVTFEDHDVIESTEAPKNNVEKAEEAPKEYVEQPAPSYSVPSTFAANINYNKKLKLSASSAITGYIFTGGIAVLGAVSLAYLLEDSYYNVEYVYSNFAMTMMTTIMGPIVYAIGAKGKLGQFNKSQKIINGFAWTSYALGVFFGFLNTSMVFSADSGFIFYSMGEDSFSKFNFVTIITGLVFQLTAMTLFSTNAVLTYKNVKQAMRKQAQEELYSGKRSVAVLPSANAFVGANKKVSGGTLGVAVVF